MSTYSKTVILTMIKDKKELLFGSLPYPLSNEDRHGAWKEVHEKATSLGVIKSGKSWEYCRDVMWANWKRRTLEKRGKKGKTGSEGGRAIQFTDLGNLVLDIIGRETPLLVGLPVPESMEEPINVEFELPSIPNSPEPAVASNSSTAAVATKNVRPTMSKNGTVRPKPKVMFPRCGSSTATNCNGNSASAQSNASDHLTSMHSTPAVEKPNLKRKNDSDQNMDTKKKLQLQLDLMEIDKRTKSIQLYRMERELGLPASPFTEEFHNGIAAEPMDKH